MTLTVGSLFSGIGGLDLGLERAGMRVVWQSEIDPYACRVLAKHWPDVPNLGDITTIDWSSVERPDVICGGYPCQPFSLAGVRRGGDDARHLWPHFHRAICDLRPRYALLENVPGHLSLGFDRVLGDLAEIGYDTEWCSIPAAAVGAPHLRWRLFAVAYPGCARRRQVGGSAPGDEVTDERWSAPHDHIFGGDGAVGYVADADGRRLEVGAQLDGEVAHPDSLGRPRIERPEEPRLDTAWAAEPHVGRVAHGVPRRVDRLRTLGNAVVPQVAELIGRRIVAADETLVTP